MNATKKEEKALFAQLREGVQKFFPRPRQIGLWRGRSVIHHRLVAAIKRERFTCQASLFLRGEKDRFRVTQDAIFRPRPVEQLLEMLERVSAVKPRIEHPVRKDKIRRRSFVQRTPDPKTVVLPDPVHHDSVVLCVPPFEPRNKTDRITVTPAARPERVNRRREFLQPRIGWRIERNHLHLVAAADEATGGVFYRLKRSADRWIKRMNAAQYLHPVGGTIRFASRNGRARPCSRDASNADDHGG